MIVVLGSRHDPAALALVAVWPGGALCSAEDLGSPGWRLRLATENVRRDGESERRPVVDLRWVVGGQVVADADVTGVCVRRTTVYPEELVGVRPPDREYVAAECSAFVVAFLTATRARVVNPVRDGALADDVLRPEGWLQLAAGLGIPVCPLRVSSRGAGPRPRIRHVVTVLGERVWGSLSPRLLEATRQLVSAAGMVYARVAFDDRGRFLGVSLQPRPTDVASVEVGQYLAGAPR